jgi:hypothetical protein
MPSRALALLAATAVWRHTNGRAAGLAQGLEPQHVYFDAAQKALAMTGP